MICGTCHYYQPARNPKTGRLLPSQPGDCRYEVVMPAIPYSMYVWDLARHWSRVRPSLRKIHVGRDDGANCECWAAKAKPAIKSAAVQVELGLAEPHQFPPAG